MCSGFIATQLPYTEIRSIVAGDEIMKYMGSKRLLAKHILPIILKDRQEGQWYVEPFCGGCNTLSEVTGNRIGADSHYYLIYLWQSVAQLKWLPPQTINNQEYDWIKRNLNSDPALSGYVGFTHTFGSQWMRGWAKNTRGDDYSKQAYNSALKQFPKLRGVIFKHCSYENLKIPEKSIIYCDPPYSGTEKYRKMNFNHGQFWEQAHNWVFDGHKVFVSEYNAPSDWVCVWSKEVNCNVNNKTTDPSKPIEKLFVHRSQI